MYRLISVLLIILSVAFISSCGMSGDTVATVGSAKITKQDFKQALSQRYPGKSSFTTVDSAGKMAVLNRLIDAQRKVDAAKDLDLENSKEYKADYMNKEARILSNKYYERVIVDKLFPENIIHENYEKQKDEVNASHILIGYKGSRGSKATRSKEEAKKLATEIAKKAKNGEDFAKLAEQYSEDPSAKRNKGNMGFFTWGRMVDAFQRAAFSMKPGEVSDPVETVYGFHVIKVIARKPNPNFKESDYQAHKFEIKRRLYFTKRDTANKMWQKQMAMLKAKSHFKLDEKNIKKLVSLNKKNQKAGKANADDFTTQERNIVLATWDGNRFTLGDLLNIFYGPNFRTLSRKMTNDKVMNATVKNVCSQLLVVDAAKKMGIDQEDDIKAELAGASRRKLAAMAENEEVKKKIVLTDEELKKYYQQHAKEFIQPAEMEMWEIYVTNKKIANKVARLAKAGRNFEKLASRYSEDKYYQKKKGYLGYRQERRRGAVSKKAFEVGPHKIAGPVKYRKGWAIIKTGKLKPETQRSFEAARAQVRVRLNSQKLRERRSAWEKELKEKYPAKINYTLVEKI